MEHCAMCRGALHSYMASSVNRRTSSVEEFFFATIVTFGTYGPLPCGRDARFHFWLRLRPHHTAIAGPSHLAGCPSPAAASAEGWRLRNSCVPHAGCSRTRARAPRSGLSDQAARHEGGRRAGSLSAESGSCPPKPCRGPINADRSAAGADGLSAKRRPPGTVGRLLGIVHGFSFAGRYRAWPPGHVLAQTLAQVHDSRVQVLTCPRHPQVQSIAR